MHSAKITIIIIMVMMLIMKVMNTAKFIGDVRKELSLFQRIV